MSSSKVSTPNSQKKSNRRHLYRSSVIQLFANSPKANYPIDSGNLPLNSPDNLEKFERLEESLEELKLNIQNLQKIHFAICNEFNESFASFLYGLLITMWCVDFPGCPTLKSWEKLQLQKKQEEKIFFLNQKLKKTKEENEFLKEKLLSKKDFLKNLKQTQTQKPLSNVNFKNIFTDLSVQKNNQNKNFDDGSYVSNEGSFILNPLPMKTSSKTKSPYRSTNFFKKMQSFPNDINTQNQFKKVVFKTSKNDDLLSNKNMNLKYSSNSIINNKKLFTSKNTQFAKKKDSKSINKSKH